MMVSCNWYCYCCYCCLFVVDVDDDDDDVLLLAAAVATAYIGGNISYLHVPYLTLPRYITLHYPLAAVYVACLFSCLMTRYMSR